MPLLFLNFLLIVSLSGCGSTASNLSREKLAETIVTALANGDTATMYKISPQEPDYKFWYKNMGVNFSDENIRHAVENNYENTRDCFFRLRNKQNGNNPDWKNVTIKNIIYDTEDCEGNKCSAILVELESADKKKYYLQIDSALSVRGWIIQDDIILVIESEEAIKERIRKKNRQE